MDTPSEVPSQSSEEQFGPLAACEPAATKAHRRLEPPALRPRGWIAGTVFVTVLALTGLGAYGLLLRRAVDVQAAKSAWEAGLAQRTEERKRIDDAVESARSVLSRITADIKMADQELGSRQSEVATLEATRKKIAEVGAKLSDASEQLVKAVSAKEQAAKATKELEDRNASLIGETTQLAERRKQLTGDIARVQTELKSLGTQVSDLTITRADKVRLDSLVADLQTQVRMLEARRDQLTNAVGPLEQQRAEFQIMASGVSALYGEATTLNMAMEGLKKQKDSLENEVTQARQAALNAKRDQQIAEKAAADAVTAQLTVEKARRTAEQAAGDAAARTVDIDKARLAAEARLQQVREALAGAEAALEAKQALVTQKEKELQALEARLREIQRETDTPSDNVPDNGGASNKTETQPGGEQ